MDMTIHDFDMARFLCGSEVTEVHAYGAVLVDPEIGKAGDIDTAVISLKFANGALGIIENSRKAVYGYDQRVEVFGAKGTALADNNTPTSMVVINESGTIRDKPLYFFLERYKNAFVAEMQAFVDAIRELMARYRSPIIPGLPRFTGGAVGYLSYDAARWFEPTLERAREAYAKAEDENETAVFMLFDTILAFDHVKGRILLIANVAVEEVNDGQLRLAYQQAQSKLAGLQRELDLSLIHI